MYNSSSSALGGRSFMKQNTAVNEGGYFNSHATENTLGESPANQKPMRNPNEQRSLLPVVLRQVLTAEAQNGEDLFLIDGRDTSQITVVGLATEVSIQATLITFALDDGTGRISVRMFQDAITQDSAFEGSYVRVFGRVQTHANQKSLIAFKVIPVYDHNEITYHTLEAIYIHCFNQTQKMNISPARPISNKNGASGQNHINSGTTLDHMFDEKPATMGVIESAILEFIRASGNPTGSSVDEITRGLRIYDRVTIVRMLESMSTDALLYTTIDDQHYQVIG